MSTLLQILGLLGLGAFLARLVDIWLERIRRENERLNWIRDHRLAAYSELAKEFLSFGLSRGRDLENPFEAYAVASNAFLLTDDDELVAAIDQFIVDRDRFKRLQDEGKDEQTDRLYRELSDTSRDILQRLRKSLLQK